MNGERIAIGEAFSSDISDCEITGHYSGEEVLPALW
jgi:hypothetical protein